MSHHSETVPEQFLRFAPDAIVGIDRAGEIVIASARVEQVFGYECDQLIGSQIEVLLPERFRTAHKAHRSGYFSDPRARPMGAGIDLYGLRADGSEFPAEIRLSSLETEHGTLATAAIRDVTDRKRAQEKFEQLLELAPDAIVGVDRSGKIVLANAQAKHVFGYDPKELIGSPIEKLIPTRYREAHEAYRSDYFDNPRTRPMGAGMDLYGRRADGTSFPAEISLSSIGTGDDRIATAAIRDITDLVGAEHERERLQTELKLNQSRRMESVGQLAGGIAHDFNNLLGVILNYAEFAAAELNDRPKVREDVEEISAAAQRAALLTRQLLIFSRREIVKQELLNLNDVVADLEKLLHRTLGEQIELKVDLAGDLWNTTADAGQMEQIVINLAVNARDAMPDGGVLTIDTKNVELDAKSVRTRAEMPKPGRYVRLTVADSGCGMDRDVLERAFEPFFSTKPKAKGTGLGLATIYGIVEQTDGDVYLQSERGKGTSVEIHLPAGGESSAELPAGAKEAPDGNGERILVVEDEEGVRRMTTRMLSTSGYEVVPCARGKDALDLLADSGQRIDLLLTDVVMPEMQGKELAAAAIKIRPDLKILYMSGYSDEIIAEQNLKAGVTALLEKPFTSARLLISVRELLDKPVHLT